MAVAVEAGALDVAGNSLLLDFLASPMVLDGELTMRLVQAAAFAKFTLLAAAGIVAVIAAGVTLSRLTHWLWDRRTGRARALLVRGTDVLPPVEPSSPSASGATTRWDSATRVPAGRLPAEVGIAASGGGIRSSCVTLDALQSLRAAGELGRAGYLVSVSGGGYTAGAFQLALQPVPNRPDDPPPEGHNAAEPLDVFAPGLHRAAPGTPRRRTARPWPTGGRPSP